MESCSGCSLAAEATIGAVPGKPDGAVGQVVRRQDGAIDGHESCHVWRCSARVLHAIVKVLKRLTK